MNEREIFAAAMELPTPAERAAYLTRVCGQDRHLRLDREVEAAALELAHAAGRAARAFGKDDHADAAPHALGRTLQAAHGAGPIAPIDPRRSEGSKAAPVLRSC